VYKRQGRDRASEGRDVRYDACVAPIERNPREAGAPLNGAGLGDGVDRLLAPHRAALGEAYAGYRNHAVRLVALSLARLGVDHPKREEIEIAAATHEIGRWLGGGARYVAASLAAADAAIAPRRDRIDRLIVRDAIIYQRKMTPYRAPNPDAAAVVNALRSAEWIEHSGGRRRMGLDRKAIDAVRNAVPVAGWRAGSAGRVLKL